LSKQLSEKGLLKTLESRKGKFGLFFGGMLIATLIILWQYPWQLWSLPVQNFDSVAHFSYVAKIYNEGFGAIAHLTPDGQFYPPLFHLISALFMKIGIANSVATAISFTWLFEACIIFPLGMTLFTRELFVYSGKQIPIVAYLILPILATIFACYPYALLEQGTLYPYGFACGFIPYLLMCSLRLLKRIHGVFTGDSFTSLIVPLISCLALVIVIFFIQPRALFLYVIIFFPFALFWGWRLRRKFKKQILIVSLSFVGVSALAVGVLAVYVVKRLNKALLFHPENWFPTILPTSTFPTGLVDFVSGVPTLSTGLALTNFWVLFVCIVISLIMSAMSRFECVKPLVMAYALIGIVYVNAIAGNNGFAKLISAPWYKNAYRVFVGMPIVVIPMFIIAIYIMQLYLAKNMLPSRFLNAKIMSLVAIACIALALFNPTSAQMKEQIEKDASFDSAAGAPNSMLTQSKLDALSELEQATPSNALIIADPFNGSSFAYSMYNRKVVFPTLNPRLDKNHAMNDLLLGFNNADVAPACSMQSSSLYFLEFGAVYKTDDPIVGQYGAFHDKKVIQTLLAKGNITLVKNLAQKFPLYKVNCAR
jgi:hypothetical protein